MKFFKLKGYPRLLAPYRFDTTTINEKTIKPKDSLSKRQENIKIHPASTISNQLKPIPAILGCHGTRYKIGIAQ